MKHEIAVYRAFCSTSTFTINGIDADSRDFGEQYDHGADYAEDYACGDMRFDPKPATKEVLDKYNITSIEYDIICGELETKLSFGECGWCV